MTQQSNAVSGVVSKLAERNVRVSRVQERISSAMSSGSQAQQPRSHIGPYLAVARLHGAGGIDLAHRLGALLGWPVLDHEVIELVANHLELNPAMVDLLDSKAASWVSDVLSLLVPHKVISRDTYTRELRRAVQLLAVHGEVILVGHSAHLFLPRERGLAVRVVANLPDRTARVAARTGLTEVAAAREISEVDRARAHFTARTFGRDVSDDLLYDLVLNSSSLSLDTLADVVVSAWRRRWVSSVHGQRGTAVQAARAAR